MDDDNSSRRDHFALCSACPAARRARLGVLVAVVAVTGVACASNEGAEGAVVAELDDGVRPGEEPVEGEPAPVERVGDDEAVGVQTVESGSAIDVEILTRTFSRAVSLTAGTATFSEPDARQSVEDCEEPSGCRTPAMDGYLNAKFFANCRVDVLGDAFFASGNVREGARIIQRRSAQAPTARAAVADLGWQLGAALHDELAPELSP